MTEVEHSFDWVNYAIRPAKATQRHMLLEAMSRLAALDDLTERTYVGFGSTFFVDFRLVHQRLGVQRMFSIEQATNRRGRFDLNKPFDAVRMLYGTSAERLSDPGIRWHEHPAIVWLDYDGLLGPGELTDIENVLRWSRHGTMLIVTFDCAGEPPEGQSDRTLGRAERLLTPLEPWVAPDDLTDTTATPPRFARLACDVLDRVALEHLEDSRPSMRFDPCIRLRYRDSRPMATWGGVLYVADRHDEVHACHLDALPWTREAGDDPLLVRLPNLTPVERGLVEARLPDGVESAKVEMAGHDVDPDEVDRLERLYRYMPRFLESFA